MPEIYFTFGTQYGDAVDAQESIDAGREPRDPHPTADWATGDGYLTVVYGLSVTDLNDPDALALTRERARQTVWTWLDGRYAFDYDERPEPQYAPRGEVARMVLP